MVCYTIAKNIQIIHGMRLHLRGGIHLTDEVLILKIEQEIKRRPKEIDAYKDLFALLRDIEKDQFALSHQQNKSLRTAITSALKICNSHDIDRFYALYRETLLFDAPHYLDSYMLYLEIDRPPQERFYQPRRKILKTVTDSLQDLYDDRLDELFLEEPPRVGKTTLLLMFVSWILGKISERSNLYSAYSDTITTAFYNGVLEILGDPVTYKWKDIFPKAKIVGQNSKEETINIDRKKRYPSLTCRSLYGTLNGACDCNGFLISDDLIGGIEEACNKDRLLSAWSKVDNNLIPRAKENAKLLWCGTRWSLIDPAGLRMDMLKNEEKYKNRRTRIIRLPALNENDESNFDYDYGVGYSTEYYQQRRASFERNNDMASWNAQYQQDPIEREGAVFSPEDLRFYNGELPQETPDRIFIAVDPAFGGGDFVAAPVGVQYGEDVYIPGVVYDNRDKKFTQPLLADLAVKHSAQTMRIEANKSTEGYKDGVEMLLKKKNYRLSITTKAAPPNTSKITRIFDKAPDIREHFIFLEDGKRDKAYSMFMQNVFSFKIVGRNKNDDAPDSLAMLADMMFHPSNKVEAVKRPF